MNCFVVGTGRCGTSSFYQAAKHIKGWTAGHETAATYVGPLVYPKKHIEVNAQLVYRIPSLLREYPEARWVHLIRDRDACIRSLAVEAFETMQAFAYHWFQTRNHHAVPAAAEAFYDQTNELISTLLPNAFVIRIEELQERWTEFCSWLGVSCAGTVVSEFSRAYNPGIARGRDSYVAKNEMA